MGKIAKKFRYVGERTLSKMGNSLGVALPANTLIVSDVLKGKKVSVYFDGKSQVLIELKPDGD